MSRANTGDVYQDTLQIRRAFDVPVIVPRGGLYQTDRIADIPVLWTEVTQSSVSVILYLHGGGYVACTPETYKPITFAFAKRGFRVVTPAYPRAPENPFPTGLYRMLDVYRSLLDRGFDPSRLAICGDSAGGGMALALLILIRDCGLPLPACSVVFSPWTDLTCSSDSLRLNYRSDPVIDAKILPRLAQLYLNGSNPANPLASPIFADLAGLPPISVHASDIECLRDDATRFGYSAELAGVTTELKLWKKMPHVWPLFQTLLPEARQVMDEASKFISDHINV
ncbi:alpha/beta hydrolase [Paraburkholderia caribensis]|uniref:alpha/beta hydrolase n=1 Tax=Paraburkholderia TaxID=1822464 RepID=UPI001CC38EA4|nr:alpha/beta hydrolase [Paraburkholderia caribensis]BEU25592.1 alpha/beta hydrolase [Paraburkholderia sp. 22B1P]